MECIKFCGAFELALRGHDETEDSDNPGIFCGLINFTAALDSALSQHLESATVFKGTSKTIQNELLDIMYETAKNEINKEINKAKFVAVISDDILLMEKLWRDFGHLENCPKVMLRQYQPKCLAALVMYSQKLKTSTNSFPRAMMVHQS